MADDESRTSEPDDNEFSGCCPLCGQPYLLQQVKRLRAKLAESQAALEKMING